MGMFDSVYYKCLKCGDSMEVQTKTYKNTLGVYDKDDLPLAVGYGVMNECVRCESCGVLHKVKVKAKRVKSKVVLV